MLLEELKERMEYHDDIPFSYNGKDYVILAWYEGGPLLCECGNEESSIQFKDSEDLLENCFIDNINVKDLVDDF